MYINPKTWFAYCRKDGFVKTKHRGRMDVKGTWQQTEDLWVSAFRNREVIDGFSVMKEVGATDEWCSEAYLDTDYDKIDERALLEALKRYYMNLLTGPDRVATGEVDEL